MKNILTLTLLFLHFYSYSKDSVKNYPFLNSKQEGVVKLKDGDSFNATIDFERLPAYLEITKEGETKAEALYANNFSWIMVDSLIFVPIKYRPNETTGKNYSLVQVIDTGKINLYRYFSFDEVISSNAISKRNSFSTCLVVKKEGVKFGNTDANTFINFKKGIERYVKDYPALNNKIQEKEKGYHKEDLEAIVKEYNDYFGVKQKELQEQKELEEQAKQEAEREKLKEELRQEILKELQEDNSEKKEKIKE